MSYRKRLDQAFETAPTLPINRHTQYVFFSDCHRGTGSNNDNFLKNSSCYFAALQYYYQYGFCYIEAGDGDELWENCTLSQIVEFHNDVFCQLSRFHCSGRLYMLYGNHDMSKKTQTTLFENLQYHEGIILTSEQLSANLFVTHGHQADLLNSSFWKLARFLVRHLWSPLEAFGVLDPTSAAKNNRKKGRLEKKYITYATENNCILLTGHTHKPTLCTKQVPYCNCGSCVHPKCITCIELCGFQMHLVKWYASTEKSEHFGKIYAQCPPSFPVYIKREVLSSVTLS
ncbi:MAG: serine/threonine protein phosphatase [Lachnospiraceae bacterium]|nr:serine/threonine protein phosphatase [Lachnospiraceae bacterium]